MKKIIFLLAAMVLSAVAGEHASVTIRSGSIATNAAAVVTNSIPVSGKIVSLSMGTTLGSATVSVYTVSNVGSSLGSSKTIQSAFVTGSAGMVTNYAAPAYLAGDYLVARFDNATATSSVLPVVTIIYEK